jgi:hypothetical protein
MSHLKQREFLDEYARVSEIKYYINKPRYKEPIKFIIKHFEERQAKVLTRKQFQQNLCIVDKIKAYEILEGLVILGILQKHKQGRNAFYLPNYEWWEIVKQGVEDD